jgi:hypothetical protein
LHGNGCDSEIFKFQLSTLTSKTKDSVEFVFLDGLAPSTMIDPVLLKVFPKTNFNHLQYMTITGVGSKDGMRYEGVDTAVDYVLKAVASLGPFDGLLGFSQGSNLATILIGRAERGMIPKHWRFVITMNGSRSRWADEMLDVFASELQIPSLHVIGEADPLKADTESLTELYSAALRTVLRTAEGHKPTRDQEAVAKICAFLSEQQQAPSHL